MSEALTTLLAIVACWRWWYWKREAYRTRDAAFDGYRKIREELKRFSD